MFVWCLVCCISLQHTPLVLAAFCCSHAAHTCRHKLILLAQFLLAAACWGCSLFAAESVTLVHWEGLSTPARIDLKWFLNVLMAFPAAFHRCNFGGTFWYLIPCFMIACRYSPDASLLSICFLILTPQLWSHCISFCTFLLMSCFSWASWVWDCHLFHTVPLCTSCLDLRWQEIVLFGWCTWFVSCL